jgi:hypothetical protein
MSARKPLAVAEHVALALLTALLLAGCSYDYLQRSDRVAYSAGDAVKANLERETTSPSKKSMYSTSGLGKDGTVVNAPGDAPPVN